HRPRPDAIDTAAQVMPDDLELEEAEGTPLRRGPSPTPRRYAVPTRRRFHPLFWGGVGALAPLLLWWGISPALVLVTNILNTIHYGYPRTFQIDAVVGQNDDTQHPSHFVALNLHGTVTIIDFPGGDVSKARNFVITSLIGPESDLDPVILTFVDVNHNGK